MKIGEPNPMSLRTAVIIATKGRPQEVSVLLETLDLQTVLPDVIVVSTCDASDIEQNIVGKRNLHILFGPAGLPAQRNRALSLIRDSADIVVFFDDDFIPSRFWIERIQLLFATLADVGTVTGRVLADGVTAGGLPKTEGQSIVNKADLSEKMPTPSTYSTQINSPYGCNMAFRIKNIEGLMFDERLALYGWLEDLDFGLRAGMRGGMISTDLVWGVHLGVQGARSSGIRFGYSQVVNPWYLMKKGLITRFDACRRICRGLAGNAIKLIVSQKSHVDRRGRLKGNIIGIKDIMIGKWLPEKVAEL